MIPLITGPFMQSLGGAPGAAASAATPAGLAAAITVASRLCESFCQRSFYARRYSAERYNAISQVSLSLRHAPLVQLNLVTLLPDGPSPTIFPASAFDIDGRQARLSFVYNQNASFFSRFFNAGPLSGPRADIFEVDYFCGYGWVTPLAEAAPEGATTLTLAAASGRVSGQGVWALSAPSVLVLDSDLPTEEAVSVTAVAGNTVTCSPTVYAHAAQGWVSGQIVPADAQMACAIAAANLLSMGDTSKEQEMVGRLGGYVYTQRKGGVVMTHEVRELLAPYREIFV